MAIRARSSVFVFALGTSLLGVSCGASPMWVDEPAPVTTTAPASPTGPTGPDAPPSERPPEQPPEVLEQPAPRPMEEPAPAVATGPCDIEITLASRPAGDGQVMLRATARNTTDHRIEATLVGHCPGTTLRYEGLPGNFDYAHACTAGACADPSPHLGLSLDPGESRVIESLVIDGRGGSCNAPLPRDRTFSLRASAEIVGASSCSGDAAIARFAWAATPSPPERPASPTTPPERCPAMGCAYRPCGPGQTPPTGCAAVCGCQGNPRTGIPIE